MSEAVFLGQMRSMQISQVSFAATSSLTLQQPFLIQLQQLVWRMSASQKTMFSNLFTELSFFKIYYKITLSLLITISQKGLNTKNDFPYIALCRTKVSIIGHESNHLDTSQPETLLILIKHAINEQGISEDH